VWYEKLTVLLIKILYPPAAKQVHRFFRIKKFRLL
jgi:hypothetical protein